MTIAYPTGYRAHQLGMRDGIEIAGQIRLDHLAMAIAGQSVLPTHRLEGAVTCAIGVLLRLQVGLKDRFKHQHRRRLHHPVPDRRDARGCQKVCV